MGNLRRYIRNRLLREELTYQLAREIFFRLNILLNLKNKILAKKLIKKYFSKNKTIKIQFGSGKNLLPNFLNTDILGKIPVDVTKLLPFPNESVDLIYSSNLIEHIYYTQFKKYIQESFRVLKKGGMQIIITPALDKITHSVYSNKILKTQLLNDFFGPNEEKNSALLINNLTHRAYMHKFIYDFETIKLIAKKSGFKEVYEVSDKDIPNKEIRKNILEGDRAGEPIFKNFVMIK